jgi:hypothetical protein
MKELPTSVKQTFFDMMSGCIPIEDFEQWVYSNEELEAALSDDDYLALLSLNYKRSGAKYELFNLLQSFTSVSEYETLKLTRLLNEAKIRDIKLPGTLAQFYDLYCDGYYFLQKLGLGLGLSMYVLPAPYKVEHWSELKESELKDLINRIPSSLENEVDEVLKWLEEGKIVLTGAKDQYNHHEFIDNRSDAEKATISQYGF